MEGGAKVQEPEREWLTSPTCAHSEVKLSVVTYLTNSIVDEILQELYHSHKSLVRLLHAGQARTCPPPQSAIPPKGPGMWAASLICYSHLSFPRPDTSPS